MNPFTTHYHPDFFCDRENEMTQLKDNLKNGLNTLIHSPRRLGKSALIKHLFHQLEQEKEFETLFIDLFASAKTEDLLRSLAEAILKKYHSKNILQGIKTLLKGITPTITFAHDGTPSISLGLMEGQQETTLSHLFDFLEKRKKKVVVAFDEFQEVATYPEKAEALLRTYSQKLSNVRFIYSGSTNHLLQNMFYSASRPFYHSSEVLVLEKISNGAYYSFIESNFTRSKKEIEPEAIEYILDFTDCYTYYTQVICNQAYYKTDQKLTAESAVTLVKSYLDNRKIDYLNLYKLLSENQKKVAIAVAKQGIVTKPTSIEFLMKFNLPSASSTLQAVNTLHEKEILFKLPEGFVIYDIFFRRFLEYYF